MAGDALSEELSSRDSSFDVWKYEDRVGLVMDGPQSLLTQSSRYGLQVAMFLPILAFVSPVSGNLDATLLWGKKRQSERSMRLSHMTGSPESLSELEGLWKSTSEEMFERCALRRRSGGGRSSDGEVLLSCRRATGDGPQSTSWYLSNLIVVKVAYVNIVGFWRKKQVLLL